MEKEIGEWDKYMVPVYDVDHAGFMHQVPINFTLSGGKKSLTRDLYHKQIHPLKGIISAYTNTCGGCIVLQNDPDDKAVVSQKVFDAWRNDIKDQFNFFLLDSQRDDTKFEYNQGKPSVYVKPCTNPFNLCTVNTHLYTRQYASKTYLGLQESVTRCMTQELKAHPILQTKLIYNYKEKLPFAEEDHIEFKYFSKACSANDLLTIINECEKSTIGWSLFAMANLQGGGKVLIGVNDDGEVLGQPLSELEEQVFKEGLLRFYTMNLDGMKRFCSDHEYHPVEGRDFIMEFIPVTGLNIPKSHCSDKSCKDCPNKRRVLIKISIFQNEGLLFIQQPECYKVRDNGKILKISVSEWYRTHKESKSPNQIAVGAGNTKTSHGLVTSQVQTKKAASLSVSRNPTQSESAESLDAGNTVAYYKKLSYKENSSMFKPQPAAKITAESIAGAAEDYEIFKLRQPCNFHPSCDVLLLRHPSIKEKLDAIKDIIGKEASFALVESSLFSCISHDLKASDIAPGSPLKSPDIKPEHHLLDIFAVDETGAKNIICLFEGTGTHHGQEKSYGLQLVRVLKKRLTEVLKQQNCERSEVHIKLTILRMENDDLEVLPSSHLSDADGVGIKMMKIAMAHIFLAKESVFKSKMGRDIAIQFTSKQAESLLGLGFVPITVITGGPGTGKSLLAQCLCEKYGKSRSIYICSSRPLEKFVQYMGKAETFLLTSENLLQVIQDLLISKPKSCIVLDESHLIGCEKELWIAIFETFRCSSTKCCLFIFRDSEYQDYQNNHFNRLLTSAIDCYKKLHAPGVIHEKVFTDVLRNSQTIGSYLFAIQENPRCLLQFKSTLTGDDIALLVIPNLRDRSAQNGLILHLRSKITDSCVSTVDIAILIDGSTVEKMEQELELFLSIFRDYWPEIKVHRADVFPREGITIDSAHNFTGLDADVILYIVPLENDDIISLQNIKYKTAVVSRAINRVEFLQDAVVEHKVAVDMKFDKPPTDGDNVIKKPSPMPLSTATELQIDNEFFKAASEGNVKTILRLLNQGAGVNGISDGRTALEWAAARGHLEVMKLLVSHGADTEQGWRKPLAAAASVEGRLDCVQWLIQNGADVNGISAFHTALWTAATSGHLDVLKLLVSHGADMELGTWKPLAAAADRGHLHCVWWLLQNGADVNSITGSVFSGSHTALWSAATSGHLEVMKLLVSHGAEMEAGESKPLTAAAKQGHADCVEWLLQKGASQGIKNQALKKVLEIVKDVPTYWSDERKAGVEQIVHTLRFHGAVTDVDD